MVDFPPDRLHPQCGKGFAYVEFETADEAENAMKHMDGGETNDDNIKKEKLLLPTRFLFSLLPLFHIYFL